MASFCPHCGFDLANDEPMERGGLWMDPRGLCTWRGQVVHLTRSEHIVLWSILKADGRFVTNAILNDRLGYDGDHNCATVLLSRIRAKLNPIARNPIETVKTHGVRMAVHMAHAA